MKRVLTALILIVGLCVESSLAELDVQVLTVTTGTNATALVSATNTAIRGCIEQIVFDVVGTSSTGDLWVVVDPAYPTTTTNVTLATNASTDADMLFIPRFDSTDTAGAALTGDPPERWPVVGESVIFNVRNATATNLEFKAVIKYEK